MKKYMTLGLLACLVGLAVTPAQALTAAQNAGGPTKGPNGEPLAYMWHVGSVLDYRQMELIEVGRIVGTGDTKALAQLVDQAEDGPENDPNYQGIQEWEVSQAVMGLQNYVPRKTWLKSVNALHKAVHDNSEIFGEKDEAPKKIDLWARIQAKTAEENGQPHTLTPKDMQLVITTALGGQEGTDAAYAQAKADLKAMGYSHDQIHGLETLAR